MPKSKGRKKKSAQTAKPAVLSLPKLPEVRPLVACPNYFGKIDVRQFNSLNDATRECLEKGWDIPLIYHRLTDSVITRARNVAVAFFLQQTDCTDLVFVDADISWQAGSFVQLLSHKVELVAGAYRTRGGEERYPIVPFKNELVLDKETGLVAVEAAPTGFMRITRACAEKMVEAYGDRWYADNSTAPGLKIPCLFDFDYIPHPPETEGGGGIYYSEDFVFCKRWNALGETTWVDPRLVLHHAGEAVYTGCLMNFLNAQHRAMNPQSRPPMADIMKQALSLKPPSLIKPEDKEKAA